MENSNIQELTKREFEDFSKKGLVLIDFFADWCMPCLMMAPIFEELSERFKGKIKFGKVNVEDNSELAQRFEVSSIPNIVLLKDGKTIDRFIGAISAEDLEDKLNRHL